MRVKKDEVKIYLQKCFLTWISPGYGLILNCSSLIEPNSVFNTCHLSCILLLPCIIKCIQGTYMAVVTQGCEHLLSLSIFVIPVGAGKVLL